MRDFFYNKGDVLIAILIILIAAVVIYWRVGVIMNYSATGENGGGLLPVPFADEGADGGSSDAAANGGGGQDGSSSATDPVDPVATPEQAPVETQPETQPEQDPVTTPAEQTPDPAQTPEETPAAAPAQITVAAGGSWSGAADALVSAGAITDKSAFMAEVVAQGADSKLKVGTFSIPAGSSNTEIIAILIK
jgi:hypothetical protein